MTEAKVKNKGGRPTDYTQELADDICSQLADGLSMRTVCKPDSMPNKATVFKWLRTKEEFTASHLKGAQNICVTDDDFDEKVKTLDKNKPVYVYCKMGGRSADAAKKLKKMGFTKVYDMKGGILSWEEKKLKTEK